MAAQGTLGTSCVFSSPDRYPQAMGPTREGLVISDPLEARCQALSFSLHSAPRHQQMDDKGIDSLKEGPHRIQEPPVFMAEPSSLNLALLPHPGGGITGHELQDTRGIQDVRVLHRGQTV